MWRNQSVGLTVVIDWAWWNRFLARFACPFQLRRPQTHDLSDPWLEQEVRSEHCSRLNCLRSQTPNDAHQLTFLIAINNSSIVSHVISFSVAASRIWNSFCVLVYLVQSLMSFWSWLKTYIFHQFGLGSDNYLVTIHESGCQRDQNEEAEWLLRRVSLRTRKLWWRTIRWIIVGILEELRHEIWEPGYSLTRRVRQPREVMKEEKSQKDVILSQ